MKCHSILPLTALMAVICIQLAVYWQWLPPGLQLVEQWQQRLGDDFYALLLLIIFLESIVYLGFYLPGQFIAVVLVVLAKPDVTDIAMLTLTMVVGATLGSACNYALGCLSASGEQNATPYSVKSLLPAMIHINALAFYMFNQGLQRGSFKVVWLAGLLNLPYYLLLIAATAYLSEDVLQLAENTRLILILLACWLLIGLALDIRRYLINKNA